MDVPSATISFPSRSLYTFQEHLKQSDRIVALLGTSLSASASVVTPNGDLEGVFDKIEPEKLAAFDSTKHHPELDRSLNHDQRQQAVEAEPNEGHMALAKLAEKMGKDGFLALSMSFDDLYTRAGLPANQIIQLYGSRSNLECSCGTCDYADWRDTEKHPSASPNPARERSEVTFGNGSLLRCLGDDINLIHPRSALSGGDLAKEAVAIADSYFHQEDHVDLLLVLGTVAQVRPAETYIRAAVEKGARVAFVTTDREALLPSGDGLPLTERDWCFIGDPVRLLPELLKPLVDEFAFVDGWY